MRIPGTDMELIDITDQEFTQEDMEEAEQEIQAILDQHYGQMREEE